MSSPFDRFAKDVLDLLLSDYGRLESEVEAPALASQRADLFFVPDPAQEAARRSLGTLGRMTEVSCLLEPQREAPGPAEVGECLRKLLNHRHARALGKRAAAERSWLLCGGRPDRALREMRFRPSFGWPPGFHDLGEALPLIIVVLSELERTADTLALRLMGAGSTLRAALHDLGNTPPGAVCDALVKLVIEQHIRRRAGDAVDPTPQDEEEREIMRHLPFVEELERRCREEGRNEGRDEGVLRTVTRAVERRLGRELLAPELSSLRAHVAHRGETALDQALDLDPAALAAWLADRAD